MFEKIKSNHDRIEEMGGLKRGDHVTYYRGREIFSGCMVYSITKNGRVRISLPLGHYATVSPFKIEKEIDNE